MLQDSSDRRRMEFGIDMNALRSLRGQHTIRPSAAKLRRAGAVLPGARIALTQRMPSRSPAPASITAFTSDMGKCIGAIAAWSPQRAERNPPAINCAASVRSRACGTLARSVLYFSMGFNHCVDPTCPKGPVMLYQGSPRPASSAQRRHLLGCQYSRGTVRTRAAFTRARGGGKCDMCHGPLTWPGSAVQRLPEGAIAIEIDNVLEWRTSYNARPWRRACRLRRQPLDDPRHDAPSAPAQCEAVDRAVRPAAASPLVVITVLTPSRGACDHLLLRSVASTRPRVAG